MVSYYSKKDYIFKGFEKAKAKHKKYTALIQHKKTKKIIKINFGDDRYQQYKDSTGLGLYSNKNHLDKKRRASYRSRHKKDIKDGFYSAGLFSMRFLWT